jgi:hypothetical protein
MAPSSDGTAAPETPEPATPPRAQPEPPAWGAGGGGDGTSSWQTDGGQIWALACDSQLSWQDVCTQARMDTTWL